MRAVIQRVERASVSVRDGENAAQWRKAGSIETGFLVLLGIEEADGEDDILWLAQKIARLRVFDDEKGVMNLGLKAVHGKVLVVSQFTLMASYRKGNRPSWLRAEKGDKAVKKYERFCEALSQELGDDVERGVFGADMRVDLINSGPVTICMDTKNKE